MISAMSLRSLFALSTAVLAVTPIAVAHSPLAILADSPVALVRVPNKGIQPEAVVDAEGVVHLLYFSGEPRAGDLFYVRSPDFARTFSPPIRANSQPGSAIGTGTIRGGQLALGRNGRVHVTWNGSDAATPKGVANPANGQPTAPFLYARSNPGGTRFEPQRNLTTRGYFIDGGGSVAADGDGNVYTAWHAAPVDGQPGEDHRMVWMARSSDDGAMFGREEPVSRDNTGACGCCGMRALATDNMLFLMYRAATAMTHRDVHLLQSADRGRTFRGSRVHQWEINTCPMTSMSFATTANATFGAWETAGQVYFGRVDARAAGIPASIAAPGAGGSRKHPRLAVNRRGETLLVWTEGTAWARGGSFAWQVFDASGRPTEVNGTAAGIPVWSFATPIARPDGGFTILY
jgi:hypothetical protein